MNRHSRNRTITRSARVLSAAACLAISTTCALGLAQQPSPDDETRARNLYEEGTRLLDTGDLAQACPRLAEAVRLVPDASGAHLALGVCFERAGRLASALLHLDAAAALADPETLADRRRRARESAEKVRPRVPRLVARLATGVPASAIVRVDGRPASIAGPLLLDAGRHEVELFDGAQVIARRSVTLQDGEETRIDLAPDRSAPPSSPPSAGGAPFAPHDEATTTDAPPWTAIGAVGIGVGGAGLILGAISGAIAANRDAASDEVCDERDFCPPEGAAARDEAFTWAAVSTVSFVAGGALAATGVVLVLVDSGRDDGGATRATLRVSPTGLDVGGAF